MIDVLTIRLKHDFEQLRCSSLNDLFFGFVLFNRHSFAQAHRLLFDVVNLESKNGCFENRKETFAIKRVFLSFVFSCVVGPCFFLATQRAVAGGLTNVASTAFIPLWCSFPG